MVLIFCASLMFGTTVNEVHTELQVEATKPPDRAAELAAEISRAQAELSEARAVADSLPDGPEKAAEQKRLSELEGQVKAMRSLVAALPKPQALQPPPAVPSKPAHVAPRPAGPGSGLWIALGFGLIVGVFLAFALVFRSLPGAIPAGATRTPQLAIISALLVAVGPQLQRLGYDQLPIVLGWMILGVAVVARMGHRRVRSQMESFALDRHRRVDSEDHDD